MFRIGRRKAALPSSLLVCLRLPQSQHACVGHNSSCLRDCFLRLRVPCFFALAFYIEADTTESVTLHLGSWERWEVDRYCIFNGCCTGKRRTSEQGSGVPRTTASPSAGLQAQVRPLSQTMESLLLRTQGAFSLRWTHLHTRCRNERRPLWLHYSSESPSPYICMAP